MNMWLVGAGYWGSKLLESLKKFDVAATVIDIRNGQTIADINTLDPVMLATPLWQHHAQAQELLCRGHDVYIEKPMAETLLQVLDIGELVQPGKLLMVGHIFVHHPQMAEIKAIIAQGTIGELTHITSRRLNWGIYQTKTDPLLSLATHDISIVLELAGNQATVNQAQCWNYSNNTQADRVWFSGTCNLGVSFDIDVSWHWPVRTRQTVIMGTKGQIIWDQDANTVTCSSNVITDNRAVPDSNPLVSTYSYALTPLEAELQHWVDCVNTRRMPTTGLESAKAVARVIDHVKELL
jgi:UDP-2-acetamido-3-amino-2,3-dideoxy-glucuronate N-acetyltransferase